MDKEQISALEHGLKMAGLSTKKVLSFDEAAQFTGIVAHLGWAKIWLESQGNPWASSWQKISITLQQKTMGNFMPKDLVGISYKFSLIFMLADFPWISRKVLIFDYRKTPSQRIVGRVFDGVKYFCKMPNISLRLVLTLLASTSRLEFLCGR